MKNFSDSLNFLDLKKGLSNLNIDASWCQNKEEAVKAIYKYFIDEELNIEFECPNCGGDLPELDICPFCLEIFVEIEEVNVEKKQKENILKENKSKEIAMYGDIKVSLVDKKIFFNSTEILGQQFLDYILKRAIIKDAFVIRSPNKKDVTIRDPFSEKRPLKFARSLIKFSIGFKRLHLYFLFPVTKYSKNLNLKKVLSKNKNFKYKSQLIVKSEEDLNKAVKALLETFKISKEEREK